ncbi:MAG TPA: glycosyltransferase, partial [Acidimicrobiales bacterium]|nr:glycosyltransferase [Acidimicrobiales bacterium]
MDAAPSAPAVVAVMVVCDPGDWLDQALDSLAAQDYPNLSVLVVDASPSPVDRQLSPVDSSLAEKVAVHLPDAHLAVSPGDFAQAANKALEMVEGATHVLICHDDVALDPDAIRLLVEEAYRANAGLVCPKFVRWDNPERLLSVGFGADRLGVAHELVQPGELDQGQHDAPRGVFVAPSGATLVRVDLWRALGGFAPGIEPPGEDLDVCWRAQLAGARVVVAPQARVRHLEATAGGLRGQSALPSRVRRETNRLRTLWTCYSGFSLLTVVPVAVSFSVAESVGALLRRRGRRACLAPLAALMGSVRQPRRLWDSRRRTQGLRHASDLSLWRSQERGSARLRALVHLRLDRGHELVWLASRAAGEAGVRRSVKDDGNRVPLGAQQDGEPGVEQSDVQTSAVAQGRLDWRAIVGVGCALGVVLLVGSRSVLSAPLPAFGQLPSATGGVSGWWHAWWAGTAPASLGGSSLAPPALAFMGLAGLIGLGSADVACHLLVLVPLVVGPLGAYLEAGRFGSRRGSLAAGVLYAAVPVPYNALSQGHWTSMIAYAAAPWILGRLAVLSGQAPFPFVHWNTAWARRLSLGLMVAVAASFAPGMLLLVPFVGLALCAGSRMTGRALGGSRLLIAGVLTGALALIALLPWAGGVSSSWASLVGAGAGPTHELGVSQVLRLDTGPYGGGALGWAVLVAASVPLLVGRSWRLAWAARFWAVALACMALAWVCSRGWFPTPALEVVLAPAAAALALLAGVGITSIEQDVRGYRFGWRQFMPAFGVLAVSASSLPLFAWAGGGRWGLPDSGAEEAFAFPAAFPGGDYRVLWVGGEGSLPTTPQGDLPDSTLGDLAFSTSFDGMPSAEELWVLTASQTSLVATDLGWAGRGQTTSLGHLLAPFAIRYVVVPTGSPAATELSSMLARQLDLVPVGTDQAFAVYSNAAWIPLLSVLPGARGGFASALGISSSSWAGGAALQQADLSGAAPLVTGENATSPTVVLTLPIGGVLYAANAPGTWSVRVNGWASPTERAFGWASAWFLPAGKDAVTASLNGTERQHVIDLVMVVVW